MEETVSTIFDPTIWTEPDDESSASYDIVQISPDPTTTGNVSQTSGQIRFKIQRSSTYILFSHSDTCLRFKLRYATLQNNVPYRFADIAPESDLGSMLLARATFKIGGQAITDFSNSFNIFHEIENNMEGLEFRQKSGDEQGFIPDVNSGLAESIQCAYLTLAPAANVAAAATGAAIPIGYFAIYITNNSGADLVAGTAFMYYIPGTSLALPLIPLAAIANGNSGFCGIQSNAAIAATATANFPIGPISVTLAGPALAAVAANGAAYIQLPNTTGAQILAFAGNNLGTITGLNQLNTIPLPLNVGFNPLYEPGYVRRKQYYNYTPNSGINTLNTLAAVNFSDQAWRYIDIKIPLNRLSRFCRDYQAVLGGVDIEINLTMSSYISQLINNTTAYFNTSPSTNTTNIGGINAVFGVPNAQMIIQPTLVTLDYVTYFPSLQAQLKLNTIFQSKFSVDYIDCDCTLFPAQWTISAKNAITNMEIPTRRNICYLILVLKPANLNLATQNYGGFPNGNINSIQVRYGSSTLVPGQTQNDDFTMVSNSSFCSGPKHFYGQYRNLFERWHSGKETPMSESEFRNLYTMYCFDFTDINQGNKKLETSIYVSINRARNLNETSSSYDCFYALYYKRRVTFDYTTATPVITPDGN